MDDCQLTLDRYGMCSIQEDELEALFSNLPVRCIVLLEDIDVVGLLRDIWEDNSQSALLQNTADSNGVDKKILA
jgi:hypothetical protein